MTDRHNLGESEDSVTNIFVDPFSETQRQEIQKCKKYEGPREGVPKLDFGKIY